MHSSDARAKINNDLTTRNEEFADALAVPERFVEDLERRLDKNSPQVGKVRLGLFKRATGVQRDNGNSIKYNCFEMTQYGFLLLGDR